MYQKCTKVTTIKTILDLLATEEDAMKFLQKLGVLPDSLAVHVKTGTT